MSYRYRLAYYLLLDDPDMGSLEAISRSKQAMRGWKGSLFVLDLSFLGWIADALYIRHFGVVAQPLYGGR